MFFIAETEAERSLAALRGFARFLACRRGTSATEFALIAPMVAFGMIGAVDVGLAVQQKMSLDHALRSAAQMAILDPGETAVRTAATQMAGGLATPSVTRYCACPENTDLAVACSTTCPGPTYTSVYYRLSASKQYVGYFLPAFTLGSSAKVRIR